MPAASDRVEGDTDEPGGLGNSASVNVEAGTDFLESAKRSLKNFEAKYATKRNKSGEIIKSIE